jgi:hypothetical protein
VLQPLYPVAAQWFTAGLYVMVNLVSIKNLTPVRQYVGCHHETYLDSSVTYVQFVQKTLETFPVRTESRSDVRVQLASYFQSFEITFHLSVCRFPVFFLNEHYLKKANQKTNKEHITPDTLHLSYGTFCWNYMHCNTFNVVSHVKATDIICNESIKY